MKNISILIILLVFQACVGQDGKVKIQENVLAQLTASTPSLDFGEKVISQRYNSIITIENIGTDFSASSIVGSSFTLESSFDYSGGIYPGTNGTCGESLGASSSCTIDIEFFPEESQMETDTLSIQYSDGIQSKNLSIKIVGFGGEIANLITDQSSVSYAVVDTNSNYINEFVVTITNTGGLTATNLFGSIDPGSPFSFKGGSYPGTGGTCLFTLTFARSCTLVLQYTAPAAAGSYSTTLNLLYSNPTVGKILPVSLNGSVASIEGVVRILGEAITFPETIQGGSSSKTVQITNSGYLPVTLIDVTSDLEDVTIDTSGCPKTLAVSANCDLNLIFAPLAPGQTSATVTVSYDSAKIVDGKSERTVSAVAPGKAIAPAQISFPLGKSSYDFGSMGILTTSTKTVQIINTGEVPITNLVVGISTSAISITSQSCKALLPPGEKCNIYLSFAPVIEGVVNSSLTFTYNNGLTENNTATFNLTGTGVKIALLAFVSSKYTFGPMVTNGKLDFVVQIKNIGTAPATNVTAEDLSTNSIFSFSETNCTGSLALGEICSFTLSATRTARGTSTLYYDVSYENGLSASQASTQIQASFVDPGRLTQNSSGHLGVIPMKAGSKYNSIGIYNTGGFPASITSVLLVNNDQQFSIGPNSTCLSTVTLNSGQGCTLDVLLITGTVGSFNEIVRIAYNDTYTDKDLDISLSADVKEIATLVDYNWITPDTTIVGETKSFIFRFQNTGSANATQIEIVLNTTAVISTNTCAGATLAPTELCSITADFTPTSSGTKFLQVSWAYQNGDGTNSSSDTKTIGLVALKPAILTILANSTDWGRVAYGGNATSKSFTIGNTGDTDATNLVLPTLVSPFELSSNCSSTLAQNSSCSFSISFLPEDVAEIHTANVFADFFDGLVNQSTAITTIQGAGGPPAALHKGWSKILAWGKKITFSWNPMTPGEGPTPGVPITGYQIYRKLGSEENFPTNALATITSNANNSNLTFTDDNIDYPLLLATTYNYLVRPIHYGYPATTKEAFSVVRIMTPPLHMALIHRWYANQITCSKLGLTVEIENHNGCIFKGVGKNQDGMLDLGYDLFVDQYETGENGTPAPAQPPDNGHSQDSANTVCAAQTVSLSSFTTQNGNPPTSFNKRLLNLREYALAATWSPDLSTSQINAIEFGDKDTTNCNGDGGIEDTGQNSTCTSLFGISDLAGNAWEWVSDKVVNGQGTGGLLGINFQNNSSKAIDQYSCFHPLFGIPLTSSCTNYLTIATSGAKTISPLKLHSNHFFSPNANGWSGTLGPMVGGGSSPSEHSGAYTQFWLSTLMRAAAPRCGTTISYN